MDTKDYEQKGYLNEDYKFFHICDNENIDIPFHYHDFDKLILILNGNVKYIIEGREYELLPFDFVLVNRFDIHKPVYEADNGQKEYDRIILYLNHEFLEKYGLLDAFHKTKEIESYVVRFPANISTKIYDGFVKIENDLKVENEEYAGKLSTRIDVLSSLIEFNKACISEELGFTQEARYNRKVIDIIEYINKNLSKDLTIERLADHFYMSKYHMMRVFKQETGYSVHQYVSEKRILYARTLIMSGTPATSACLEAGFKDYSSFSRAFKLQLGILPSEVKI
ncbi:AraC-type DNA-binding protein [Butyrivibrio proteoclasticus]|uniref:AraC-type DNA-binding protein n=1 Tax=Butyrivibrio proteoclasticus TaxID=43305 RepID=A0A1I5U3F3_9FIRM|nr:AraC family transcriptional regulator [Butyrivibrio proteoclasticus]SFP89417.1 AraC-type DNA-binding protein [Butyrivibrio proteoclasticus]